MARWSATGIILDSVRRWSTGALWQPVIRLMAKLWMNWSLLMFVGLLLGNQIVGENLKMDLTRALWVMKRASMSWPQVEPQTAFMRFSCCKALAWIAEMCL
jgi:hypothetical protein